MTNSTRKSRKHLIAALSVTGAVLLLVIIAVFGSGLNASNVVEQQKAAYESANPVTPEDSSAPIPVPSASESSEPSPEEEQPPLPVEEPPASITPDYDIRVVDSLPADGTYDRELFGSAWADVDRNGCDTRNDILQRDLTNVVFQAGDDCKVDNGTLMDPYTGNTIAFQYGRSTSSAVQIDHVVALSLAWASGASQWTDEQRVAFANDPENLLAVDGPTNSGKSDKAPSEWMPENKSYTCTYSQKFFTIADKYDFAVTQVDYDTLIAGLATC